ncbi:hypothetical protein RST01_28860 [Rummeliibacillus stabekisii]|nr:hypothetical protein RST01_28860 [Rummeliibacillus stabekisii]
MINIKYKPIGKTRIKINHSNIEFPNNFLDNKFNRITPLLCILSITALLFIISTVLYIIQKLTYKSIFVKYIMKLIKPIEIIHIKREVL